MSQKKDSDEDDLLLEKTNALQNLVAYFSKQNHLDVEDVHLLSRYAQLLNVKKDALLLAEGDVSNHTYFVVKGLFRIFNRNAEGEEINFGFYSENWWVNDPDSFSSGMPSDNIIQALEDSILLSFKKKDFEVIMEKSPHLLKITYNLLLKNVRSSKNRIWHHIKDSPTERYEYFLKQYGEITNRIPLYMIASFLGISRKTLTRVRGGK